MRPFRRRREPSLLDEAVLDVAFVALDLETTGLDPASDHVVSIGWVPIEHREVVLADAAHLLVRPPGPIGESATIHGLTDADVASAPSLDEVLPDLVDALSGYVLVAHHAPLDIGFLRAAAAGFSTPYVDTLALEQRLHTGRDLPPGALRLDAVRRRYGLPAYAAHSALTDALAVAELLLAQVAELEHRLRRPATLRDLGAVTPAAAKIRRNADAGVGAPGQTRSHDSGSQTTDRGERR
ncbi:MAG: hypothetical protein LT071_03460 [Nocardioides sp.]|nr:hypothetical protein [Nocardioides sp.]